MVNLCKPLNLVVNISWQVCCIYIIEYNKSITYPLSREVSIVYNESIVYKRIQHICHLLDPLWACFLLAPPNASAMVPQRKGLTREGLGGRLIM